MEQHDRLAGAPRAGSVVIQANAVDVEELASHGYRKWDGGCVTLHPTPHLLHLIKLLQLRRSLSATLLHASLKVRQVLLEHLLLVVR